MFTLIKDYYSYHEEYPILCVHVCACMRVWVCVFVHMCVQWTTGIPKSISSSVPA